GVGSRSTTRESEADHRAESLTKLLLGQCMLRMTGEARIINLLDFWCLPLQQIGRGKSVFAGPLDPQVRCRHTTLGQPALERSSRQAPSGNNRGHALPHIL